MYAPFTCRITSKKIEKGQYVSPGKIVLGLADDSVLELEVPLDSRDAFDWLQFAERKSSATGSAEAWFSEVKPVLCEVTWTEDSRNRAMAIVNRVSLYDKKTRTVKVVLQIDARQFDRENRPMPLVSGMFCRVRIPGRAMRGVVELPRWAVSFEKTVYVIREGRLATVAVSVARVQNNKAYISKGLMAGDQVVITRLVNPLERSLVRVIDPPSPHEASESAGGRKDE